ncbi:MAG: septum site-determining protein MinC, partial [Rhodospirillales bacterium]
AEESVSAETASVGEERPAQAAASKVVIHPVRSGRQIYAQGADLIVLASISPGAELIADGHIHVYGALRGRALAGIGGNTDARIFCRSLEAELVSVAGYWRVRDDIPEELIGKPVQIYLGKEQVIIEELT